MNSIQHYFKKTLEQKCNSRMGSPIPELSKATATKLIDRINGINLHAHTYSFNMNFKYSGYEIQDLLYFAFEEGLCGVGIHIDYGKNKGLRKKSIAELEDIATLAKRLKLEIILEISSTSPREVNRAVQLAGILGAKRIRLYIIHGGRLSSVIENGIIELKHVAEVAADNGLEFVLESNESLKSVELVKIIQDVNSPHIKLLFDFGNMINACEHPMEALEVMSPYVTHVHIKGVCKIQDRNGFGHTGVLQGEDDLPQAKLLFDLLMLGDTLPQVTVFALEQVVGYSSRGFRFTGEDADPLIPKRWPSQTEPDERLSLEENLLQERRYAREQVIFVKNMLEKLKTIAEFRLNEEL